MAIMAAQVGLDPREDLEWIVPPEGKAVELFAERQVDAFSAFPPEPQELRERKIGRMILSTATDTAVADYFCCVVYGNRDFIRAHPVATKRYLRAVLDGDRLVRDRARAGRARSDRYRVRAALRLRPPDADRDALRPLARVRRRGHHALPRAAPARGRDDRVQPNALLADGTDWRLNGFRA